MKISLKMDKINLIVCSRKTILAFSLILLSACSHDPSSVIVKELRSPPRVTSGEHIVRDGETLYSIAWFYGRDFRELADSNRIAAPYTIYPGQTISLRQPARTAQKAPVAPPKRTAPPASASNPASKEVVKKAPPPQRPIATTANQTVTWQWPAYGKIISGFSLSGSVNKGIDIRGKLGEPVRAAGAGEIVYSGSDLAGYGRLIIMKHNNRYLSAYAHNKELLVREGDSVKAGQKIAEIGSTGTTEPKLHFEIRRDGKPVDPMRYLPDR